MEVVGLKLGTHHPVIEPVSATRVRNGIFRCRDGGPYPPFCLAETDAETRTQSKKPAIRGTNARITRGVRYLKTGWWRRKGPNCQPPTQSLEPSLWHRSQERNFSMQKAAAVKAKTATKPSKKPANNHQPNGKTAKKKRRRSIRNGGN